jgi:origin recognition complex subunit 5
VDRQRSAQYSPYFVFENNSPQIPQRLVGPVPFPLDRLIAILGALLEENDGDVRLSAPPEYTVPGEYTDMETSRIGISTAVCS